MQYQFLNIFLDPKELLTPQKEKVNSGITPKINPFLFENNTSQIEQIYDFYKSNVNLLYINGFLGTGKAKIVDYSLSFLSAETIVLKYNCFNSTVLDDVLLSFYTEFKRLSAQNVISDPKIKTENFTQKVNSYFSLIEKPFIIILDSFEAILEENRKEILDFIFHLMSLNKVKIIIIGRTFESKYFKDIPLERVSTFAMDKSVFEKYLKEEKIKAQSGIIDEFYKHTRGYYFFTSLAIKLMKKEDLSLVDFLIKFKESYLSFSEFLGKRALTLVPSTDRNLFWFLSMIRNPISIDLLKKLSLYDEEKIELLTKNLIIIQDKKQIYIQDYIKEHVDESTAPNIFQKIRQYIIDLYLTQLPLKPLERDMCISRQTMRKEIEYHGLFLPKKPKNLDNTTIDINYMSYAQGLDFGNKTKAEEDEERIKKQKTQGIDLTQRKNVSINLENLPYQDKTQTVKAQNVYHEELTNTQDLRELVKQIKRAELNYHYASIIELGIKALSLKDDENYQTYLPLIYTKMAHSYQKIANYENSLRYYNLAQEIYNEKGNVVKASYVKLNIARIFYETYKLDIAKELLLEIVNAEQNPDNLKAKAYIQLAELEENQSNTDNAFEYYKRAIELSNESSTDISTLSELYFKYALALDDKNDLRKAVEFYKKCIELGNDDKTNKFLSSAYSNLATLDLEKNDTENAIKNYTKAYDIDKSNANVEGMYYSASKLASILQKKQPEAALEHLHTALDCAKLTKDVFYTVTSSLAIGDYYYDQRQNEFALKHYIYALDLATARLSKDNIDKINVRINDIKFKMGVEKFDNLVDIIREKENE